MSDAPPSELLLAPGVSREFLLHHQLCPLRFTEAGELVVAVTHDAPEGGLDEIAFAYRCAVVPEITTGDRIERLVERLATRSDRVNEGARLALSDDDYATDVRALANEPPVVRYVNLLLRDAHEASASDIHLEAARTGLTVRFRLDGVLATAPEPPADLHQAVVSRLKLLADLDIAERRRPQDGRIRIRLEDRELDLRISTVPTMYGESVVLRLLDHGGRPVTLDELGMSSAILAAMESLAARPHGVVLVTGPTGSGKTTTLYAALKTRNAQGEKIVTVEDPVEYQLPGITQVPVHRQASVTFGSVLRSILRQDPDVMMVGEMRDTETAELAMQAAMTGHLVFSTLHTNEALGAIPRLVDLGIPEYLVAASLEAVLAQRLVRRVCVECRVDYFPAPESVALLAERPAVRTRLTRGAGCPTCRGTGFRGRTGVFELFVLDDGVKDAIVHHASRADLKALAAAAGWVPLRADGWAKVQAGITTVEEVLRVTTR